MAVWGYARVSTSDQKTGNQRLAVLEYANVRFTWRKGFHKFRLCHVLSIFKILLNGQALVIRCNRLLALYPEFPQI